MANKLTKAVSGTVNKTKQYPKTALGVGALAIDGIANSFGITKTLGTAVKGVVEGARTSVDTILAAKSGGAIVGAAAPFALAGLGGYYSTKLADKMKLKGGKKLAMQALGVGAGFTVAGSSLAPAALVAGLAYPVGKGTIWGLKKSKDVARFGWKWAVEKPTKAVVGGVTPLVKAPFKTVKGISNGLRGDSYKDLVTA